MRREYWVILLLILAAFGCSYKDWHVLEAMAYATAAGYAYLRRV